MLKSRNPEGSGLWDTRILIPKLLRTTRRCVPTVLVDLFVADQVSMVLKISHRSRIRIKVCILIVYSWFHLQ